MTTIRPLLQSLFDMAKIILLFDAAFRCRIRRGPRIGVLLIVPFFVFLLSITAFPPHYMTMVLCPVLAVTTILLYTGTFRLRLFRFIVSYLSICLLDALIMSFLMLISNGVSPDLLEILSNTVSLLIIAAIDICVRRFAHREHRERVDYFLPETAVLLLGGILIGTGHHIATYHASILYDRFFYFFVCLIAILIYLGNIITILAIERDKINRDRILLQETLIDAQKKHFADIAEKDRDLRSFRHDIQGHIIALSSLISKRRDNEALAYIQTMQAAVEKTEITWHVGNDVINALLSAKFPQKKRDEWKLSVSGALPKELYIPEFSLCVICANAIDNAIEAVAHTQDKKIEIRFGNHNGNIFLAVTNACEKITDLKTSKPDRINHGFGLANIRNAIDQLDGILRIRQQEGTFSLTAYIPNQKVGVSSIYTATGQRPRSNAIRIRQKGGYTDAKKC